MKIFVQLSSLLGSTPTKEDVEESPSFAEEVYKALASAFDEACDIRNEEIAADVDPIDPFKDMVSFGYADHEAIVKAAFGWNAECIADFKSALTQVLNGDNVSTANIAVDTTKTFELMKATAVIDDSAFEPYADYGVYLAENRDFRHLLNDDVVKAVIANPDDYAVVDLQTT